MMTLCRLFLLFFFLHHSSGSTSEYAPSTDTSRGPALDGNEQMNSLMHSPARVRALQDAGTRQKVNQRVEQEQNMKLVGADVHTEIEMPVHIKIVTITEDEANAIIANKGI